MYTKSRKHKRFCCMFTRTWIVVLSLQLFTGTGCEKEPADVDFSERQVFVQYDWSDGFTNDAVLCIHEGDDDAIWFGTGGDGLYRYKDYRFKHYTTANGLADNYVEAVFQLENGELWIGTAGGLSVMDGSDFTNYYTSDPEIQISDILQDKDGNTWMATQGYGCLIYNGEKVEQYFDEECANCNFVNDLYLDDNSILWWGTRESIENYDGKYIYSYSEANGQPIKSVHSVYQDAWGDIWFGTSDFERERMIVFSGNKFIEKDLFNGLIPVVYAIAEDGMHNLWFGTIGCGVICYDGAIMESFQNSKGFKPKSVMSLCYDSKGNLWMGTFEDGVIKYIP